MFRDIIQTAASLIRQPESSPRNRRPRPDRRAAIGASLPGLELRIAPTGLGLPMASGMSGAVITVTVTDPGGDTDPAVQPIFDTEQP